MPAPDLLLRPAARLLAEPSPAEVIDPPQYSIAWVILAVLCLLVIAALIVGTLRITRAIEKRIAYRSRPSDLEALKAEFLRAVNDVADRHDARLEAPLHLHDRRRDRERHDGPEGQSEEHEPQEQLLAEIHQRRGHDRRRAEHDEGPAAQRERDPAQRGEGADARRGPVEAAALSRHGR